MSTDNSIKTHILAELVWDPMVEAAEIGVTVRDGLVTLSGHVDSFWQKRAAEQASARIKGVRAIADEIEVRLPPHIDRSDAEIAAAAVNRLDWDGAVPKDAVHVVVQGGHVTLKGEVAQQFQRRAAAWAVQPLWGVLSVANQITVTAPSKSPADPDQISDDIRRALNRSWFASDTVHVSSSGGIVTLSGSAETLRDRDLAVQTALSAPGTTGVENHIRIG
jgi:osmotically-inducible protein OsmY